MEGEFLSDKQMIAMCADAMFMDTLFKKERPEYVIIEGFRRQGQAWFLTLMPHHDPQRMYSFVNLGDKPILMRTYTKTNVVTFENLRDLHNHSKEQS